MHRFSASIFLLTLTLCAVPAAAEEAAIAELPAAEVVSAIAPEGALFDSPELLGLPRPAAASNICEIPITPGCPNFICEPSAGENCLNCPIDCRGVQSGNPNDRFCCGDGAGDNPVGCEDPRCTFLRAAIYCCD